MIDQNKLNQLFEAALKDQEQHKDWEYTPNTKFAQTNDTWNKRMAKRSKHIVHTPNSQVIFRSGYTVW